MGGGSDGDIGIVFLFFVFAFDAGLFMDGRNGDIAIVFSSPSFSPFFYFFNCMRMPVVKMSKS